MSRTLFSQTWPDEELASGHGSSLSHLAHQSDLSCHQPMPWQIEGGLQAVALSLTQNAGALQFDTADTLCKTSCTNSTHHSRNS